jgi:hypothetical protein
MAAKPIDLGKLTPAELKNLLANNERHGQTAMVHAVLEEMARRGIATRREYRSLAWNQDRVRDVMLPFRQVASAVRDNQRTTYTEAGGRKIGHSKDNPEWMWVDTYSAIKTPAVNAVFVCYIKRPGEDPEFQLHLDGVCTESYNADRLPDGLNEWRALAARAATG